MKYEELKCEHCNGQGEKEVNRDGADVPVICGICDGSGIDPDQLNKLIQSKCNCILTDNGEPNWEEIVKIKKPADNKCAHAGCWSEGEMVGFARCMIEKVKPLESKLFHANRIRVEDGMSCINECNALRTQILELKQVLQDVKKS